MLEDVLLENRSVLAGEIIYRSKFPAGGIEAELFIRTQPNCKCHLSSALVHMEQRTSWAPRGPGFTEVVLGTRVTNSSNRWEFGCLHHGMKQWGWTHISSLKHQGSPLGGYCWSGFIDWGAGQFHSLSRFTQLVSSWAEIWISLPWFQVIRRLKP